MSLLDAFNFLVRRKRAYQRTFSGADADTEMVLKDLAKFCRAHTTTAAKDPELMIRLEGRREVWLRIQSHLHVSDDELWKLYGGPVPPSQQKEG